MWTEKKNIFLVAKAWNSRVQGSNMYCLMQKCKLLKSIVQIWNSKNFGNIFRQLRKVDDQLTKLQPIILANSGSFSTNKLYSRLLLKRTKLFNFSSNFWKQCLKKKFLC